MAKITFITTDIAPFTRKAFRLNIAPLVEELVEVNHISRPDDLCRYLELHTDTVSVEDAESHPGGRYTLVIASFSNFTLYGYLVGEQYHWCTITQIGCGGILHFAPSSYRDMIYQDGDGVNAHVGYLQSPHALRVGVEALPLLEDYNILDPRFTLLQDYVMSVRHTDPLKWVQAHCYEVFKQAHDNLLQSKSVYTTSGYYSPEPWDNIIRQLKAQDLSIFGEQVTFEEATDISDQEIDYCLASLTDPMVTYDEELWLHNIRQTELLLKQLDN